VSLWETRRILRLHLNTDRWLPSNDFLTLLLVHEDLHMAFFWKTSDSTLRLMAY